MHISCSLEIFPSANALVTSTSQFFAGYCRIPTFDDIHYWSPWWPLVGSGLARIRRWSPKAGSSVTRVTAMWSVRYGRWESLRSSRRDGDFGWDGDDFLIKITMILTSQSFVNTCIFLGGDLRWYKHLRIWSSRFGDSTVFCHGWLKLQFAWQIDETGSE